MGADEADRPRPRGKRDLEVGRVLWALVFALAAHDAHAAGVAVNEQNARGLGSAFAGEAAAAEDAGTVFFNPAGLTLLSGTQLVSAGFAIKPTVDFHNRGSSLNPAVGDGPLRGGNDGNGGPMALLQTIFLSLQIRLRPVKNTRHTFITTALEQRWSPATVARYCGTSLEMIDKHYAGVIQASLEADLARLPVGTVPKTASHAGKK